MTIYVVKEVGFGVCHDNDGYYKHCFDTYQNIKAFSSLGSYEEETNEKTAIGYIKTLLPEDAEYKVTNEKGLVFSITKTIIPNNSYNEVKTGYIVEALDMD